MNNATCNLAHFRAKEFASPCHCQALITGRQFIRRELHARLQQNPSKRVLMLESLDVVLPSKFSGTKYATADDLGWDYIFSVDLFAELPDHDAQNLLRRAAESLCSGGTLLIANTFPDTRLQMCPLCTRKQRHYRTEQDLAALAAAIPTYLIQSQIVFRDEFGLNAYLELTACQAPSTPSLIRVISTAVQ